MKRLIILLLLLCTPLYAAEPMKLALSPAVIGGVGQGSAAGCVSTKKQENTTCASIQWFGTGAVNSRVAGSFTTAAAYTKADKFCVNLAKNGDPNSVGFTTITPYICTDSSGPDVCTALDSTLATSGMSTSSTQYCFAYATGKSLTTATVYWIALYSNAVGDGSNNVKFFYNSDGANMVYQYNVSWSDNVGGTPTACYEVWNCE